ncbi:MAG: hypothetical protein U0167_10305 [bacterium]
MVKRCPFAWVEKDAWDLPTLWEAFGRHHPQAHPVSYSTIAVIFFEETAFCNIRQAQTKGSLGMGFGQLEVSNPEKKEFYAWAGLPTDYRQVADLMLASKDVAVRVHCQYFQYLTSVKNKALEGCLDAQVGSHRAYKQLFRDGAKLLDTAIEKDDRAGAIRALNHARTNSPKQNGISEKFFPDFWQFILPDGWSDL